MQVKRVDCENRT